MAEHDGSPQHSWHPDPERDLVVDSAVMRALSHPLRNQMVMLLRQHGPATATGLAKRLGVNTGATSYHLRQLADAGLVVEDESRGNGRDRWWRSAHRGSYFDEALIGSEPELATAYLHSSAQHHADMVRRAIDELPGLPVSWQKVFDVSDFSFHLTVAQLGELLEQLRVVLDRYRTETDDPHPRGARRVMVQLQAFPQEGR